MKSVAVFVVALIFLQSNSVTSLQCYQCTGPLHINSGCENLAFIPPKECAVGETVCASYVLKTALSEILHRKCGTEDICSQLAIEHATNPSANIVNCNVCTGSGCNSA